MSSPKTTAFSPVAWYEDEARFAAELARGRRAELRVAMTILPCGLAVRVGGLLPRSGLASSDERCRDQIDIEVEGGHQLEVKSRAFAFTKPADYPYPTAYVGARRRWHARRAQPCTIVILSEPTGRCVLAPIFTRDRWIVEHSWDGERGFDEESYAVPRELLLPDERLLVHLKKPCGYRDGA